MNATTTPVINRTACKAGTGKGNKARCRQWAKQDCQFCPKHQSMMDAGKEVPLAPTPNTVLLVCLTPWAGNGNDCIFKELEGMGIPNKPQDRKAKEERHTAHAKENRRDPNAYRPNNPDSGSKLREVKLKDVIITSLFRELYTRYDYFNPHIQTYPGQPYLNRLVLAFSDEMPKNGIPELSQEALDRIDTFTSQTFRDVDILVNPLSADDKVVCSVKLGEPNTKLARHDLKFDNGLFGAVEVATPAKS